MKLKRKENNVAQKKKTKKPKPIHTTKKTKSLILIEIFLKCFVKLEMADESTVATKTVAACQNDFELPIAMVIRTAEMNHVTYPISNSVFFQNFGVIWSLCSSLCFETKYNFEIFSDLV